MFFSERKISRRRLNSIDGLIGYGLEGVGNVEKNFVYEGNGPHKLIEGEKDIYWNIFENENANLNGGINDDITGTFVNRIKSRKVSAEDDFLFNYFKP